MTMDRYYADRLTAERLQQCYALAPPRVCQYLAAEIEYTLTRVRPADRVLELGCGYGRVLERLVTQALAVVGIDTSAASLRLAHQRLPGPPRCWLARMDAARLGFGDHAFDVVLGIQNSISAFKVDQRTLLAEALRVTRPGGRVLFSSYAARFWSHRLAWFEVQAAHGLLGEIDRAATGHGMIICKDGFRATTVGPDEFLALTDGLPFAWRQVSEVDESSLFCELVA